MAEQHISGSRQCVRCSCKPFTTHFPCAPGHSCPVSLRRLHGPPLIGSLIALVSRQLLFVGIYHPGPVRAFALAFPGVMVYRSEFVGHALRAST